MPFPSYVHSVVKSSDDTAWPVQAQGRNECGCTAAANALNLLVGSRRFNKDDFLHEAGLLFQPGMGGTPSPRLNSKPKIRNGALSCTPTLKAPPTVSVMSFATSPTMMDAPGAKI